MPDREGYEIGVLNGCVRESDVVAVVGVGPVGLASVMTAASAGASRVIAVDGNKFRLEQSREFGATDTVDVGSGDEVVAEINKLSRGNLGVDVAIEAVGLGATLRLALDCVRPGGHVANIGVHGESVELPLERDRINNLTITTGLVNATTAPQLLDAIQRGDIAPEKFTRIDSRSIISSGRTPRSRTRLTSMHSRS